MVVADPRILWQVSVLFCWGYESLSSFGVAPCTCGDWTASLRAGSATQELHRALLQEEVLFGDILGRSLLWTLPELIVKAETVICGRRLVSSSTISHGFRNGFR